MKIIEVIPHLQSGGGEKFTVDISNAFSELGNECTVITLYDNTEDDILKDQLNKEVSVLSLGKKPGIDIKCMIRLRKLIAKQRPAVVHLNLNAITYAIYAALTYRKCKYIATIHSEAKMEAGLGLNKYIRKLLFGLNLVSPITISQESETSFKKFYGYGAKIITNGCSPYVCSSNIDEYSKYREGVDKLFIHAGRIHDVKNQEMLVKAFDKCISAGINIRLLIVGRIADNEIFDRIKPYLSDRIVYLGEKTDVKSIMYVCDAFCLSSKMEGMPMTIIEAMSVGCVPICTPVGGCINIINHGHNGMLSNDIGIESYTNAILEFFSKDANDIQFMKNNCIKDYNTNYSISKTAESYLKYIKDEKE